MGDVIRRAQGPWHALRRELRRAAVAYLILALGLAITVGVTGYDVQQSVDADRERLDRNAATIEAAITDRLARYLDVLRGARSLFAASGAVDREEWDAYVRGLDLQSRYPGTRSLAYARWVPAAEKEAFLAAMRAGGIPEYAIPGPGGADAYVPLTYVTPLTPAARGALGFDALADPVRRVALVRARDTGQPATTASTALASEPGGVEQRSVILYVPVYRGGGVPGTVEERQAALQGFVLTGWRMDDLMAGLLGPSSTVPLAFAITDDAESGGGQLLYASDGADAPATSAALTRPDQRRTLAVAGRTWTIGFVARSEPDRLLPALIAGVGLTLSVLLALLARAHVLRQEAAGEARFHGLLEAAPDAIVTVDADGRIALINTQTERLFGYPRAELLGRPIEILLPPRHRAAHPHQRGAYTAAPHSRQIGSGLALSGRRRDGSEFPVEISLSPLATPDGMLVTSAIRDVSAQEEAAAALREAAENFDSLFGASEAISITAGGRMLAINPAYTRLFGWTPEDVVGQIGLELIPLAADRTAAADQIAAAAEQPYTIGIRHKDGPTIRVEVVGRAIRYQGRPARLATLRDMTERARAEAALQESEERFRSAFEHAAIGKALVGLDGRWLRVNRALCTLLGYDEEELLATTFQMLTHPDDLDTDLEHVRLLQAGAIASYELEKRYVHKDGHVIWGVLSVSLVRDEAGAPLYFISQIQDVGERRALEERLSHQATHDTLTGLPNRALFLDRLAHALARRDQSEPSAVLFIDLDRFKAVNDTFGHDAGDALLVAVAERLRGCLREADTAARFGGDEFAVLLDRVADLSGAVRVAERIIARLGLPVAIGAEEVVVTPSVGIALAADPADTADELLRFADVAMYRAKAAGRGAYDVFYPGMHDDALPQLLLEHDLRLAIEREEFVLHYQPLVAIPSGEPLGAEALVRWQHPTRGLLGPGEFIPLAEQTGLIVPLGRWVLAEACRQGRSWRDLHPDTPPLLSVNVAARQLRASELLLDVTAALTASGLPAGALQLEITEGAAMANEAATIVTLQELKALGVRLAIDDFGTGYSSLAHLRRFPVDTLKIDKSFVDGLGCDREDSAIVGTIITLAHTLGLRVTAEGIETPAQRALLQELGCDEGQGYLFARPLAPPDFAALLAQSLPPARADTAPAVPSVA